MFDNLKLSIETINLNLIKYVQELYQYPFKLVSMILDLAIVIFVIVKLIQFAKNKKLMQLFKGIFIFVLIVWISYILNLRIVSSVLTAFLPSGVVALVIIFQPEIRRGLEQIGTNKFTSFLGIEKDIETKAKEDVYKIAIATEELSKHKTGALIVLQRDIKLDDITSTGVEMNSDISPQLLVNIFVPNTPLHDGAVIISNGKILSAACILPLADNRDISKELGTRHRAALGISKESDAIAVVVSEESGKISIAKDGTLIADVNDEVLKRILIKNLVDNKVDKVKDKKFNKLKNIRKIKKENKESKDTKGTK